MASGLLLGTSMLPHYPWALFFCMAPIWWYWLQEQNPWKILLSSWILQFVFSLVTLHWIAFSCQEFFLFSQLKSYLALVGVASIANYQLLVGAMLFLLARKLKTKILLLPLSYSVAENFCPLVFPWNFGHPWILAHWQGFQFADIIGFQGLSLLTLAGNALFTWSIFTPRRLIVSLPIFLLLFFSLNFAGSIYGKLIPTGTRALHFAAIQPNISNIEKSDSELGQLLARKEVSDTFLHLSLDAAKTHPDFIVWPETAFAGVLHPAFDASYFNERVIKMVDHGSLWN